MPRANFLIMMSFVATMGSVAAHAGLFGDKLMINGAGATFPYPLYSKWFSEYQKQVPDVAFNYQSIGSGGGIRQLTDETVDFGASDAPMNDEQLKKAKRPIVHIPAALGAVVITYHLPQLKSPLRFTGQLVADIFQKKITRWDDAKILELNPELKPVIAALASPDILVVHRSDGSGTTSVFSEYLSKVSEDWKLKVGKGSALRWPTGIGGKGNEGVASFVQQMPGSIGYVELVFAKTLKLPYATVENGRHEWVEPSMASVAAAAEGNLKNIPEDFRTSLTLIDAHDAYPISSLTYILFYEKPTKGDESRHAYLLKFLNWSMIEGQELSSKLNYTPLPKSLVNRVVTRLKSLGGVK